MWAESTRVNFSTQLMCFGSFISVGATTVNTLTKQIRVSVSMCMCVCSSVGLLICSSSFVVLFFLLSEWNSSSLPASHNALLFLSGFIRGKAVLGRETAALLSLLSLLLLFLSIVSFHSPAALLEFVALKLLHNFTCFLSVSCFDSRCWECNTLWWSFASGPCDCAAYWV